MCLDELTQVLKDASLYDENFVEKDSNIAFNLSIFQIYIRYDDLN
tara:strand:- start:399 stop:533 length:135 start_codon:yes stop_codon:yes gene_type:complete